MRNIIFYEFLYFRPVGTSAIAFKTARIAYIVVTTKNKHLTQEARFFFKGQMNQNFDIFYFSSILVKYG